MHTTLELRSALVATLAATGLFETVHPLPWADLPQALETLRDSPDSLALVIPSSETWEHTFAIEDENLPAKAEARQRFEIIATTRDLEHGDQGDDLTLALKDNLLPHLAWSNLGTHGLIALPLESEPILLERDNRRGREAWKITLEIRQQTNSD